MKTNWLCFLLITATIICGSCNKDTEEEVFQRNLVEITAYLEDNGLQAINTPSGLHVIVEGTGDGTNPTATSTVTVEYAGYLIDGSQFDASPNATFPLQNVIQGWTEGIPYFERGGNGKLLIPARLGYGQNGSGSIPGGSVLIFDVRLIDYTN